MSAEYVKEEGIALLLGSFWLKNAQAGKGGENPFDPEKTNGRGNQQTSGIEINSAVYIQVDQVHDRPGHPAAQAFDVKKPHRRAERYSFVKKISRKEQHQQREEQQEGQPGPFHKTGFVHNLGLKSKTGVTPIFKGMTPVFDLKQLYFI